MLNDGSGNEENPETNEDTPSPLVRVIALVLLMLFVGSGGWLFWIATHHTPGAPGVP